MHTAISTFLASVALVGACGATVDALGTLEPAVHTSAVPVVAHDGAWHGDATAPAAASRAALALNCCGSDME